MEGITLERSFLNWATRIGEHYQLPVPMTDEDHEFLWEHYFAPTLMGEVYAYLAHHESLS